MAQRPFDSPRSPEAAAHDARIATAALLAKIAAQRRRARLFRRLRSRAVLVDFVIAMATYTGVTVAVILGAIYGIGTALGLLAG